MEHRALIVELGGPSKVARDLGLPTWTTLHWSRRNSIPAQQLPAIAKLAAGRGIAVSLEGLLVAKPLRGAKQPMEAVA